MNPIEAICNVVFHLASRDTCIKTPCLDIYSRKPETINSLKKIDQSICEWERYLKKYYFFRQFLKIDKSLFWEQSKQPPRQYISLK